MRQHAGWLVAAAAICALFAGSALSGPTNPQAVNGGVYNATPPTLSDGQQGVFQLDTNGQLKIAGTISAVLTNPTIGAAVPATGNYIAGNKGGLLTGLLLDGSGYLDVNCQTGCAGGSFNNNADNVATSSTNGQAAAWMYAWDGLAWDRLYNGNGTSTQALRVTLSSDSTGQVAFASGSTTAVTQATASSLNAAVVGNVASAGADSGNPVKVGGIFNTTPPAVTTGQRSDLSVSARGAMYVQLYDSANNVIAAMQADNADGIATSGTANRLTVVSKGEFYNGTSWDLSRSIITGNNTTGTGIAAVGLMGQCIASPGALTDTRFGNLAMNCTDHSLIVSGGLAQEATTSGTLGSGVMGSVTTSAPTYTTAKMDYLSLTTGGLLRVDASGATVPSTATLQTQTDTVMVGGVNIKEINAVTPLMGNGTSGTGALRVALVSDQTTLTNTIGNVGQVPVTSGGTSIFTLTLAASTNATNVKASAGQLYSIDGFNMSSATPVWISTYNNAGTPTCGTGIIEQFMIPGNTTGAGLHANFSVGAAYSTGIAICATTGIAGTGNVAATTYVVNIHYK